MIKPIDIQEKEFSRGVRGYKENEVNEFLDQITVDLERLMNELRDAKEENERLNEELERYRSSENSLVETLEAAKALMTDISASAEKRADIILKNAEMDAEMIKKEAKADAERIEDESRMMKDRFMKFKSGYRRMLQQEMQRIDATGMESVKETAVSDFDDLPKETAEKKTDTINDTKVFKTSAAAAAEDQSTARNMKY